MADPTAKIIAVDTSKIAQSSPEFTQAGEVSFEAEIDLDGVVYRRKFTFVSHEHYKHHLGGPITEEDVELAVLTEVDKLKAMRDVAALKAATLGEDLVAKAKAKAET